jgi:hypothetical protein
VTYGRWQNGVRTAGQTRRRSYGDDGGPLTGEEEGGDSFTSICSDDQREEGGATLGDDLRRKRGGGEWHTQGRWRAHLGNRGGGAGSNSATARVLYPTKRPKDSTAHDDQSD